MLNTEVFATGISGTIGKHLRNKVKSINIDLSSSASEFQQLDLSMGSTVVHLGAVVGESLVQRNRDYASRVNVGGTKNLGELAIKSGCKKFLYVSTSHVYKGKNSPILETDPLEPKTFYSETKLEAENAIVETLRQSEVELTILRVFSILDWGMPPFTLGGAVERVVKGEDIFIENGDDERDFLTPQTIANLILKLGVMSELPRLVNICSGKATSVFNATSSMFKAAQSDQLSRVVAGRSALPRIVGDNSLLKSLLPKSKCEWELSPYQPEPKKS
jgi:nucleoside-diphosphate-sugar epimerase